jgi:nucleotide-binding universal stress UspA family protein
VPIETRYVLAADPYKAIVDTAERNGSDLIVMASHGRRGLESLLIGSETQKVLTHCRVPVLVVRS